jgi:hypothetical protein
VAGDRAALDHERLGGCAAHRAAELRESLKYSPQSLRRHHVLKRLFPGSTIEPQ